MLTAQRFLFRKYRLFFPIGRELLAYLNKGGFLVPVAVGGLVAYFAGRVHRLLVVYNGAVVLILGAVPDGHEIGVLVVSEKFDGGGHTGSYIAVRAHEEIPP